MKEVWKFQIIVSIILISIFSYGFVINASEPDNQISNDSKNQLNIENTLKFLEGEWEGIDNDKNHGTDLVIQNIKSDYFEYNINSFWINAKGLRYIGNICGRGYIKNGEIELHNIAEKVIGKISVIKKIIHIEYLVDVRSYACGNVSFSTDYKKKL